MIVKPIVSGVLLTLLSVSTVATQERGRGGENRNNVGMPWETLRGAVMSKWQGQPPSAQAAEPFKIFDNLYYVGIGTVASYLITSNDGMVLIDATYAETADRVLDNIRKMQLDPMKIKYLFITHAHTDHFGGAARIKEVTHATVGMSEPAWEDVEKQQAAEPGKADLGGKLTREFVIKDGQDLKIGNTALKIYVVPGHTDGNLATVMQGMDGKRSYRTLVGVSFAPTPGMTEASIKSLTRIKQMGPWDALLPIHHYLAPYNGPVSGSVAPKDVLLAAQTLSTTAPHPAVIGADAINKYFDDVLTAFQARLKQEQSAAKK